jgi:hypothetical protein
MVVVVNPFPLKSEIVFVATPKVDEVIVTVPLWPFTDATYTVLDGRNWFAFTAIVTLPEALLITISVPGVSSAGV